MFGKTRLFCWQIKLFTISYSRLKEEMKMKALLLTVGSFVLTAGVISNAYIQKKQFYPSVVFITKSSPSMAVSNLFIYVIILVNVYSSTPISNMA